MGFPGAHPFTGKSLLEEPCDILLPCARECVLTKENAPNIKAKVGWLSKSLIIVIVFEQMLYFGECV